MGMSVQEMQVGFVKQNVGPRKQGQFALSITCAEMYVEGHR